MERQRQGSRLDPQELRRHLGQRVRLELDPASPFGPAVVGTLVGVIDALDGTVAVLEPEGRPGARLSCHYHYLRSIAPA
ncbi:MAG TPA: hypothetical protein VNL95_05755 [Dehalococcoidia bacterium]|nr:hypothetical protein [Dehalococcoidia bacterium]